MTRRSDMMLEDIYGCQHTPETPIVDDSGEILYWLCRCGRKQQVPKKEEPTPRATTFCPVCGPDECTPEAHGN